MKKEADRKPKNYRILRFRAGVLFLGFIVVLIFLWIFFRTGAYCPWWPAIDTVFTENFSDDGFAEITKDMSREEVVERIGLPFSVKFDRMQGWTETWQYAKDGRGIHRFPDGSAIPIIDMAWISKEVIFQSNKVVRTESRIIRN